MGTQLIMTVGTNALPIWVAWHHLKEKLKQPVSVRFVHTRDTEPQKNLLVEHCNPSTFGRHISTSPGNPRTVRNDIRQRILDGLDEDTTHLHVHYTGGTQVMGVETVSAIEERLANNPNIRLETTYLDARGRSGPCLTSRNGNIMSDARKRIDVDLNRMALLNGFTLAPFDRILVDRNGERYNNVYRDDGEEQREYLGAPTHLNQAQKREGIDRLDRIDNWQDPNIDYWEDPINSTNFEYATYVALERALKGIKDNNSDRSNYKVYHKVYVKRTDANVRDREFELDVVAILGYQVVVISCTLRNDKKIIKQKGMEAIIRSRQLGGDEAQAIVLCKAHPNDARLVEKELHDEVGSAGLPLRIWGTDKWPDLQGKFYEYLRKDLHWR